MREDDVQNTWNIYSEDLYNVNTEEWVTVNMHSFDGTRKGNYFGSNEDWRGSLAAARQAYKREDRVGVNKWLNASGNYGRWLLKLVQWQRTGRLLWTSHCIKVKNKSNEFMNYKRY